MLDKLIKWLGQPAEQAKAPAAPALPPAVWVDKALAIETFASIKAGGKAIVDWTPGPVSCVATQDAGDEAAGGVSIAVVAGQLVVSQPEGRSHFVRVKVSSPALESFDCEGEATGSAQGLDAEIFRARAEDGSKLLLAGRAVAAKLWIAGKGAIDADQLVAHVVEAKATGPGLIDARAVSMAEAKIDGGGEIVVRGNPSVSKIERVGHGRAKIGSKVGQSEEENPGGIFDQLPIPKQ